MFPIIEYPIIAFRFFIAVGQANTEWYLNPVTRELKDQVKFD
jgi:hypothetical protein